MENEERDILEGLNPAQREAVIATDGPALIIAGAGSGKTRVLTTRIAYALQQGTPPYNVLALTFTKKAAGEMKDRIADMVGEKRARWIWMGTFHSVFIRFLKEYAEQLGYPPQFTIYDQSDSRSAVKQCIKELNLDEKTYKPNVVQNRISLAKNNLVTATRYRALPEWTEEDASSRMPHIADIYERYQRKCREAGAMDFDDILLNTNILFRDFPDALEEIAGRFKYILVDEYQDTNIAQYLILKKLAAKHRNICVVGDDSQSIYSFRGARIENILRFQKDYPDCNVFRLERNYRSTKTIVNAANSLIARNGNRLRKDCFSEGETGERIHFLRAFTELEESWLVAASITDRIYRDKAAYSDFAILYRTNAQSRSFEESLRKKNLPYRIFGGHSFFDRKEVKDMLSYFKLAVNPRDNEALRRVINLPARGIGSTTMDHLGQIAATRQCSLFEAIRLPKEELAAAGLKEGAISKLKAFTEMMLPLHRQSQGEDAFALVTAIGRDSGMLDALKADTSTEGQACLENVQELFNSVESFVEEEIEHRRELAEDEGTADVPTVTLSDYLENIYLLSEAEKDEEQQDPAESQNRITLMTVHASKGKEFPYVYVVGMEENLFPSERSNGSTAELEEERRLFYVAITRACKVVTVTCAQNRMQWGTPAANPISRFVREIDPQYIDGDLPQEVRGWTSNTSSGASVRFVSGRRPSGTRPAGYGSGGSSYGKTGTGGFGKPSSGAGSTSRPVTTSPAPVRQSAPLRAPSADFRPDPVSELKEGQRIEHDRFGFGTLLSFEDEGANLKARVKFDTFGEKTLLLKFARLRVVRN